MLRRIILNLLPFAAFSLFANTTPQSPVQLVKALPVSKAEAPTPAGFIRRNEGIILNRLKKPMAAADVPYPPQAVRLAVFKEERKAELWLPDKNGKWRYVKEYAFSAMSGGPGPKLYYGDLQIPEGIYGIDAMGLSREYHLALHVDYPNAFDKAMLALEGRDPGYVSTGINVHGGNISYGCVVIGNRNIEEFFLLAHKAGKSNTQVYIFPHDTRRAAPEFKHCATCPVWYGDLTRQLAAVLPDFQR